jgi:hypothetical protein
MHTGDRDVAALAARQHGVVSGAQLAAGRLGRGPSRIASLTAASSGCTAACPGPGPEMAAVL